MSEPELGNILIYQNEKGDTKIDVYFEGDTIWMSQKSLEELYQIRIPGINEHIKIYCQTVNLTNQLLGNS